MDELRSVLPEPHDRLIPPGQNDDDGLVGFLRYLSSMSFHPRTFDAQGFADEYMERHKEVTEHMQATHSEFARERDALLAKPKPLSGRDDARVSQAAAAANHIGRFQQTFHSEFDNFGYQNTLYSDAIEVWRSIQVTVRWNLVPAAIAALALFAAIAGATNDPSFGEWPHLNLVVAAVLAGALTALLILWTWCFRRVSALF